MTDIKQNCSSEEETVNTGLVLFSKIIASEMIKDHFSTKKMNSSKISKKAA